MPVMGMMMLGLEPGGHGTQHGSSGSFSVGDDNVSMVVTNGHSPDVVLDFGVPGDGGFLVPAGTSIYLPFAADFSWEAAEEGEAKVSAMWFKFTRNGDLKRKLGL
jgi:hypothetical protein